MFGQRCVHERHGTTVASRVLTVYDATRKRVESNGGITYDNRKPTKNITSLPRSALAPCTPWNIRDGQARMHTPLPCAAGNCERVPETLLFVFPRREEACIRQDRPFLPLPLLAIRQPVRERLLALCRRRRGQRPGRFVVGIVPWCGYARAVGEPFRPALEHGRMRQTRGAG